MSKDNYRSLLAFIERIQTAQDRMRATNTALDAGDVAALHQLGLPQALIDDLLKHHSLTGVGYPNSVFKHNQELLKGLKKRL